MMKGREREKRWSDSTLPPQAAPEQTSEPESRPAPKPA
jgi:hypothetical protein